MKILLIYSFFFISACLGKSKGELNALYCSLDPLSVSQNFAFYELYPHSNEGKQALKRAWSLLKQNKATHWKLPAIDLKPIVSLVNKDSREILPLDQDQISFIQQLAKHLHNRKLKGYHVKNEEQVLALPPQEIDVCKALFIAQKEDGMLYEAAIDLMALQILARLPCQATHLQKIQAINQFIFHEMRFRFPPHSLWAKDVDVYTFLPSVIDSRKGVCLGVSILYLCIAQRLDLPLEIITPPGHIYLRYIKQDQSILNIETTARGINTPSEMYLGVETKALEKRNQKELIGLAFINQAAVFWGKKEYQEAIHLYEIAQKYLPHDPLLKEFLGYNYLFVGDREKGIAYLQEIKDYVPPYAITNHTMAQDFLNQRVDVEGLKTVFLSVDEHRESILEKRKALESCLKKHPKFRAGIFQLAGTWLQLGREKEAKTILENYILIDPHEPTVNYYLSVIYLKRFDYLKAWKYFLKAKKILKAHNHYPKALKELEMALIQNCPTPNF